jgi:DNA helicase II / ATP-dependent DNA helicase PcrA
LDHPYLNDLNSEQLEAAISTRHCSITACPGSGKTKTLAAKAAFLLNQHKKVVAVTFTRESAFELRHRIVQLAGEDKIDNLLVGTFHSIDLFMLNPAAAKGSKFGKNILSKMVNKLGDRKWDIATESMRRSYIAHAINESGAELDLMESIKAIEIIKAQGSIGFDEPIVQMSQIYNSAMARNNQIDFQDILTKTNDYLRSGDISPLATDYLLVDEFQDTDIVQYDWVKIHGDHGCIITAVGDDDQSIYGFRRALGYEGVQKFSKDFHAQKIVLGTNYRCHDEILGAADHLIRNNTERIFKNLFAHKGAGGHAEWNYHEDREKEAYACHQAAIKAQSEGAQFAVIARTNRLLKDVELRFIANKTPYVLVSGSSIFEDPVVSLLGTLLAILVKPNKRGVDMLLAWAGIQESDITKIHGVFGDHIRVGATADFNGSGTSDGAIAIWRAFAKKVAQWKENIANGRQNMAVEGAIHWLLERAKNKQQIAMINLVAPLFKPGASTIEDRLDWIRRKIADQKTKKEPEGWAARLMTAHGSKGLEFDRVWIFGATQDTFPDSDGSLEEERRLMYVAMTRAKNWLSISISGGTKSQFIEESNISVNHEYQAHLDSGESA